MHLNLFIFLFLYCVMIIFFPSLSQGMWQHVQYQITLNKDLNPACRSRSEHGKLPLPKKPCAMDGFWETVSDFSWGMLTILSTTVHGRTQPQDNTIRSPRFLGVYCFFSLLLVLFDIPILFVLFLPVLIFSVVVVCLVCVCYYNWISQPVYFF